jgi:hypothetical protein
MAPRGTPALGWLSLSLAVALAGCGESADPLTGGGPASVKLDTYCTIGGLAPAIRESLIVIDRTAVKPSQPETFRTENPELFALITGLGDAERALGTGAMAPRERLTIAIADPNSGGLSQIFTGCLPGLSKDEMTSRASKGEDSMVDSFFGSDMASQLSEAQAEFRKQVILMLVQAPNGGEAKTGDSFGESAFARVLKTIGPGAGTPGTVRRVFLFADPGRALGSIPGDYEGARKSAFAQAATAQINLGQSELYLVPPGRSLNDVQRGFLDGFFLGSGSDLRFVGPFSPDNLAKPPVKIVTYAGDLPLGGNINNPMEMRLAAAVDGTLVNSWISYTGSNGMRRTPVAGQFVCNADGCELRGDPNLVLGQRWRTQPGSEPQVLVSGPFGGMRMINGKDDGARLTGRIHDPMIILADKGDISFVARRTN